MKFVLIIGNTAVGKMTVGQELAKITNLKLFHNHMSIEPVIEIFGEKNNKVIDDFRESVFKNFAKSNNYGLIFTFIWNFENKKTWKKIKHLQRIFKHAEIYYIELISPQDIRLQRNASENRLKYKASKRDIEKSNARLINDDKKYRTESYEGEIKFNNYIKIDNSNISAKEVAKIIKEKFKL